MIDKLIICVLISSLAGSLVYALWLLLERFWRKTEYLYMTYQTLHVVVLIYFGFVLLGMVYLMAVCQSPGIYSWADTSPAVHMVLSGVSVVWIAGAVIRLGYYLRVCYGHYRYTQSLGSCSPDKKRILDEVAAEMGIRKKVGIAEGDGFYTAQLGGWLNPCIYLPAVKFSEVQFRGIAAHELTHYRNGDKWIRELLILTECIHWFNPVIRKMRSNLERWDELYCDYCVCRNAYVRHKDYANTLYYMGEIYLKQCEKMKYRFGLHIGFCEEGKKNHLLERIKRIMGYKKEKNMMQKRIAAILMTVTCVCAGTVTAMAAETGADALYGKAVNATMISVEEEVQDLEELSEYVMTPEEAEVFQQSDVAESVENRASSSGLIDTSVKNQRWVSGLFSAASGQEIKVAVTCTPANVKVKVGVREPDGTMRYVYKEGDISHTFALTKTGQYTVFVWNETSTAVKVFGYYNTQTP